MTLRKAQSVVPRPSPLWRALAVVAVLASIALIVSAIVIQRRADQPIGEGQLFVAEAEVAERLLQGTVSIGMTADEAVRHVRNQFTLEAVSIVDPSGMFVTSTSDSLIDSPMENGLLNFWSFRPPIRRSGGAHRPTPGGRRSGGMGSGRRCLYGTAAARQWDLIGLVIRRQ